LYNYADFFERREATDAEIYWPNEEITRKMHTLGCHVVPKPSTKQLATFQQGESYLIGLKYFHCHVSCSLAFQSRWLIGR